jgi:hypothetical protein
VAFRKYEARAVGGVAVDAVDIREDGGTENDTAEGTVIGEGEGKIVGAPAVGGCFLVSGGGGPTRARGRTDFGGMLAEGTSCLSLSISGTIAGGDEEGCSGGEGDGEIGGGVAAACTCTGVGGPGEEGGEEGGVVEEFASGEGVAGALEDSEVEACCNFCWCQLEVFSELNRLGWE